VFKSLPHKFKIILKLCTSNAGIYAIYIKDNPSCTLGAKKIERRSAINLE